MNLSEALAREGVARPARVLHGARSWRTISVPSLDDVPASATIVGARSGKPSTAAADTARTEARLAASFQEGVLEGRRQLEAEVAARDEAAGGALAQRCERLAGDLENGITELEHRLADRVLRLAMVLAERIACRSVERDGEAVVPVLQEALATVTAPWRELDVVANPVDCPVIEQWLHRRESATGRAAGTIDGTGVAITVRADPGITPGGCRIRVDETRLDATLEARIRRAFEAMGGDVEQR